MIRILILTFFLGAQTVPVSGAWNRDTRTERLFQKGIEHYNGGRYYSALDIFRRLSGQPPSVNPRLSACYLMTMKCYFHVENFSGAVEVGREFLQKFPASSYGAYIHECFGDIFVRKGRYRLATRSYLEGRLGASTDSLMNRLDEKLKHLAGGLLSRGEIEDLLFLEDNPSSRSILMFMIAGTLLAEGDPNEAALTLFRMDREALPESYHENYETLKKQTYLESRKSVVVGLVLPLTGYDEKMGRAFLKGVQAAVESLRERSSRTVILEVMDNGGNNLRTVSSIQTLSANSNVVAIIGPISTVNAATAAAALQHSGVPLLLPVSTQVGLSRVGENVFQMNVDLHKQGRYLAEYAVSSFGLETLGVVAPADRFGKGLSDGFVQRADELGAEIVAVEWYSGVPVDLSRQFNSLREVAFDLLALEPDTSGQELRLDSLDNTFAISVGDFFPEEDLSDEERSPVDSSEIVLSSIDGIYLPIHLGDINYVVSQFSAYNLDSQLLGNSNWYEPEELAQELISPNADGMIILADHWNENDQRIRGDTGPPGLWTDDRDDYKMAVSGYDIMTFLAGQFGDDPSRATVLENLGHTKTFRGVGKVFSFTDSPPRVNSSALLLEYRDRRFTKVGEVDSDSLLRYRFQSP